jgi:hypothetical protein
METKEEVYKRLILVMFILSAFFIMFAEALSKYSLMLMCLVWIVWYAEETINNYKKYDKDGRRVY